MRRIIVWFMSTLSALVLLFSYSTSTNAKSSTSAIAPASPATGAPTSAGSAASSGSTSSPDSSSASTGGSQSAGASGDSGASGSTGSASSDAAADESAGSDGTYLGDEVMTRWGIVQVQITVADGKVTSSNVTQVPWDNHRDQEINAYAVPILNESAVSAQSADIDMISGATVTSEGYAQSLQSALDQAHLA